MQLFDVLVVQNCANKMEFYVFRILMFAEIFPITHIVDNKNGQIQLSDKSTFKFQMSTQV